MPTERDLQFLQAYLDDTLSAEQVQLLDARLSDEPELASALHMLRVDRAFRVSAFERLAPGSAQADRFAAALIASTHRLEQRRRLAWRSRVACVVAACILAGFMAGWLGRGGKHSATAAVTGPHPNQAAQVVIQSPRAPDAGPYQVVLLDEDGNVIAVQKFSRLQDARQFANDLGQYESRRQQVETGRPMLVSDQF
ncbi:MAG TPA: hypothetical protein VFC78_16710 [Tepidisphaeraceae bacterium]|nr:hypothetical protein [Tepidisphaeraceae bacterium]